MLSGWAGLCEPTLWCREVDDVAVALEHVDFLNSLDGLDVQLLERGLKLLVIGTGCPVDLLDLPAGCALASVTQLASCVTTQIHIHSVFGFRNV